MSIRLTWTDPNPMENGYKVYKSTSPMSATALPSPLVILAASVTIYDDSDVEEGTTYYYRVAAFDSSREEVSEEVHLEAGPPDSDPGDPYFGQVALLLHADGASGSTAFIDSSLSANSVTTIGGSINTTYPRFGSGSLICGPGIRYDVNLPNIPGDFTAECWVRFSGAPSYATIMNLGGGYSGGFLFRQSSSTTIEIFFQTSNTIFNFTPALGTWYHYAVSRVGGVLRLFINGAQVGGSWTTSASIPAGVCRLGQSSHTGSEVLVGYIDDVRVTIGLARYQANFTPPISAFPDSV